MKTQIIIDSEGTNATGESGEVSFLLITGVRTIISKFKRCDRALFTGLLVALERVIYAEIKELNQEDVNIFLDAKRLLDKEMETLFKDKL